MCVTSAAAGANAAAQRRPQRQAERDDARDAPESSPALLPREDRGHDRRAHGHGRGGAQRLHRARRDERPEPGRGAVPAPTATAEKPIQGLRGGALPWAAGLAPRTSGWHIIPEA